MTTPACQACGACCTNPDVNRGEGSVAYVTVARDERLWSRADLVRRFVVVGADGEAHLRLDPSGRCAALVGPLGRRVKCAIYAVRPRPCRTVQPGDGDCVRARRERQIG